MGLIERLTSWLGIGDDADRTDAETAAGGAAPADAPDEDADGEKRDTDGEPRLDPEGATETRVETTEAAVDALRDARNAADAPESAEAERSDPPDADDEDGSSDAVDADGPTGG